MNPLVVLLIIFAMIFAASYVSCYLAMRHGLRDQYGPRDRYSGGSGTDRAKTLEKESELYRNLLVDQLVRSRGESKKESR